MIELTSPLPEGWSPLEVIEDEIDIGGLSLRRAGFASIAPTGEEITGSAAERTQSPRARGYYELLERIATMEALGGSRDRWELRDAYGEIVGSCRNDELFPESNAPDRWRHARSNGVAIHASWTSAVERATFELAERDRILRSWYGEITPIRIADATTLDELPEVSTHEVVAYAFPEVAPSHFARDIHVVGVFGFPTGHDLPLVLGYGARKTEADALEAAAREALQLLAFLWGEPVAASAPPMGPTAMHHLEHFQYAGHHAALRAWLEGAHRTYEKPGSTATVPSAVTFADLTPTWLTDGLRVARAFAPGAVPLAFGDSPFAAHLPEHLRAHPVA